MLHRVWRASLLACVFVLSVPTLARAQFHFYQTIDMPGAPPETTWVTGVNDSGVAVGVFIDSEAAKIGGFTWSAGTYSTFHIEGAQFTVPTGINNAGDIVGYTFIADGCGYRGFLLKKGAAPRMIHGPDGCPVMTLATGINNRGEITGVYQRPGNYFYSAFVLSGNNYTTFDGPGNGQGCCDTMPLSINDSGVVVGRYTTHGFIFSNGVLSMIDLPLPGCGNCWGSGAVAIDNLGTILMIAADPLDSPGGRFSYLRQNGQFKPFGFPDAQWTQAVSLSHTGNVGGLYLDGAGVQHGFVGLGPTLVDPVPDLQSGAALTADFRLLAQKGRPVRGVAADGVTQVVVRIPGRPGTRYALKLLNDHSFQTESLSAEEDGGLGTIPDTDEPRSSVEVVVGSDGYAFATYRAPDDFTRPGTFASRSAVCPGGANLPDEQLGCRMITIEVRDGAALAWSVPIMVLRPLVVLIHGLWSDWTTWNSFAPLVTGPDKVDPRFEVARLHYDVAVPLVVSDPPLLPEQLAKIRGSSLGLQANAPAVMGQMVNGIEEFKLGKNPQQIAVAAAQADVVGHSMGGLIARAMPYDKLFATDASFGKGPIHKLITIDTPHLGSQLARILLSPAMRNGCMANQLNRRSKFVLRSVREAGTFKNYSGAMADLSGDDTIPDFSAAIRALQTPPPVSFPMTMVAGYTTNFSFLDFHPGAAAIRNLPNCHRDPLALMLTSTGWPLIFQGRENDAIVSQVSQLNDRPDLPFAAFSPYLHTGAVRWLGFTGGDVLTAPEISHYVVSLLNTPRKNNPFSLSPR